MLPEGLRDRGPAETASGRQREDRLLEVARRFGYRPVSPSALEFLETMQAGLGRVEDLFKTFDRRGRILALRSEVTTSVARLIASYPADGPWRLSYAETVFHYGDRGQRHQMGIECFGLPGVAAEAETLVLAAEALSELGVEAASFGLGHVGLMEGILAGAGLGADEILRGKEALARRDYVLWEELAGAGGEFLAELPRRVGGKEVLEGLPAGPGVAAAARELSELWDRLSEFGLAGTVHLDLSLVRDFAYYSGLVFQAYADGLGRPVLVGGRYDRLAGRFGPERPGVGWAIDLDDVAELLGTEAEPEPVLLLWPGEGSNVLKAQAWRREGQAVELAPPGSDREAAEALARERGQLFREEAAK